MLLNEQRVAAVRPSPSLVAVESNFDVVCVAARADDATEAILLLSELHAIAAPKFPTECRSVTAPGLLGFAAVPQPPVGEASEVFAVDFEFICSFYVLIMATLAEQRKAQQVIGRFDTFKRHLIDLILASEPTDTELYAKVLLLRAATNAVIAEYARQLDEPIHFAEPSTGPAMEKVVERGIKAEKRRIAAKRGG